MKGLINTALREPVPTRLENIVIVDGYSPQDRSQEGTV
jgi:hypothetical protein